MERHADPDPRTARTREAILAAFAALVFSRRYDSIRVADLIAAAGVGRSTFYEHFSGKDEVLVAATHPILHNLASAALNRASEAQLRATLDHVWQRRQVARRLLDGRAGRKLQERLAAMIAARLGPDGAMAANAAAAAQLTMLRLWVGGAIPCPAQSLARRMKACACLVANLTA